ncbi:TPA: hypothetical protein ACF2DD_001971 [Clostridium perfringens]
MRKKKYLKNRVGERRVMNCGEECEIVEYRNVTDLIVRFIKSGELVKCKYQHFKNGNIKSHFTPSVYGVGIVGLGDTTDTKGEMLKSYRTWQSMLQRRYSGELHKKNPTYIGCSVCEDWKYYKNFKEWYDENYYEISNQRMALDKDILNKENKIYSPNTCVFVPQNINSLFTKRQAYRGVLPIGISWRGQNQKYLAGCNVFDIESDKYKKKHLGLYNTLEEAFNTYKKVKEENIKLVADYYKNQIPKKLYDAMCRYEVSIND